MQDDPKFEGVDNIKEHLDSWQDLSPSKMKVEKLGGLSNDLWKVTSLNKEIKPRTVIYRKFGHGAAICDRERENYVLKGLARNKIAPKFYGGTEEYRVEKFMDAKELTPDDMSDASIRKRISRLVADLHNMEFEKLEKKALVEEILKEESDFVKQFKKKAGEDCFPPIEQKFVKDIMKLVDPEEMSFLKKLLPHNQDSIVFSHNDLHSQNFMVLKENKKMNLIDYEYSNYNVRGIDIANLFTETMFEYDTAEHPHYTCDEAKFPNDQVLLEFIQYYLFLRKFSKEEFDLDHIMEKESHRDEYVKEKHDIKAFKQEANELLKEVKVARLYTHYFWSLWGVIKSHQEDVEFDYVHYAYKRFEIYQHIKKELQEGMKDKHEAEDTSNP